MYEIMISYNPSHCNAFARDLTLFDMVVFWYRTNLSHLSRKGTMDDKICVRDRFTRHRVIPGEAGKEPGGADLPGLDLLAETLIRSAHRHALFHRAIRSCDSPMKKQGLRWQICSKGALALAGGLCCRYRNSSRALARLGTCIVVRSPILTV